MPPSGSVSASAYIHYSTDMMVMMLQCGWKRLGIRGVVGGQDLKMSQSHRDLELRRHLLTAWIPLINRYGRAGCCDSPGQRTDLSTLLFKQHKKNSMDVNSQHTASRKDSDHQYPNRNQELITRVSARIALLPSHSMLVLNCFGISL